ncbi:CDP-glycerol glycerophosphotransferase family protein [Ornithinibacillus sp. L9]|uniref:CDP-glycerol glycerophosphotransferase family protein n=1 Tax=Ornithinibacillus caprae TaxID=2678566 RepID=A0A6N8FDA3_9BACI|nr:CDP-glycerol glycerophosphotransferase family protein [Ornithinibacillus caprae]MUK87365.1 CDP-glycerol glycerophosphotransferase family protein [Ornithinibacillus caprae]
MAREFAISIYLVLFQLFFTIFKLFPQKKKTVCVASFGDNIYFTTRSLREISDQEIIILQDKSCSYPFDPSIAEVIPFHFRYPFSFLRSIYHLATASTILVDNYYGFLAVTNFKEETTCIQLWHASGAIKHFGLTDPSIKNRSKRAHERFQKVYDQFDYITVGSEKMASVFRSNFNVQNERIIRTGIPRTDVFYNLEHTIKGNSIPTIKDKKVILYAPTFRDCQLKNYQLNLDIEQLYKELSDEYVLFIKVHPAVSYTLDTKYEDFVYDLTNYFDINHILLKTDLLITDYSSIPFEYALLKKPMIFYAYDMEEYSKKSGLIQNYQTEMPGPVVFSTADIIEKIKSQTYDLTKVEAFGLQWNEYSRGYSSMNVAKFITSVEEELREEVVV